MISVKFFYHYNATTLNIMNDDEFNTTVETFQPIFFFAYYRALSQHNFKTLSKWTWYFT